jgi:8-oxo-dGTP diphosphatase
MASLPEAVVMVIRRGERVLIIQRAAGIPGGGYWAPPSGRIEPGETQPETVVREAAEETGLLVEPVSEVWECLSSGGSYTLHWWLAEWVSGDLTLDPLEVTRAAWLTVDEYYALDPVYEQDREFFREVFPRVCPSS